MIGIDGATHAKATKGGVCAPQLQQLGAGFNPLHLAQRAMMGVHPALLPQTEGVMLRGTPPGRRRCGRGAGGALVPAVVWAGVKGQQCKASRCWLCIKAPPGSQARTMQGAAQQASGTPSAHSAAPLLHGGAGQQERS